MNKYGVIPVLIFLWWGMASAYEAALFSDTHWDSDDTVLVRGTPAWAKHERNRRCWRETMPQLLDCWQKKFAPQAVFAIHCGDLVNGFFTSEQVHAAGAAQVLHCLAGPAELPVLPVLGNHDIAGPAVPDCAFYRRCLPALPGLEIASGPGLNYLLRYGSDLYLFVDSLNPDLSWVEQTLGRFPDVRHLFFVTHYPVLPEAVADPAAVLLGGTKNFAARKRLLRLLASRRAIVLCGHVHRTSLWTADFAEGRIVQFSSCSLFRPEAEPAAGGNDAGTPGEMAIGGDALTGFLPAAWKKQLGQGRLFTPEASLNILRVTDACVSVACYDRRGRLLRVVELR